MDRVRLGLVAAIVVLAADVLVLATGAASDGDDVSTATTTTTTAPVAGPGVPGETVPGSEVRTTDTTAAAGGGGETTSTAAPSDTQPSGGGTTTTSPPASRSMPAEGTYTFNVTGSSSFGQVPPQSTLVIEQLNETEQRQTSPSPQGNTVQVMRYDQDAVRLVSLQLEALGKTFNGPVVFAPVPPEVGQTWTWTMTSTPAGITIDHSSTITGAEQVIIAGQAVDSFVVQTRLTLSGQATGTIDLTTWASPTHGLGLRTHAVTNVTYIFPVQSDTTSELVSLNPA